MSSRRTPSSFVGALTSTPLPLQQLVTWPHCCVLLVLPAMVPPTRHVFDPSMAIAVRRFWSCENVLPPALYGVSLLLALQVTLPGVAEAVAVGQPASCGVV